MRLPNPPGSLPVEIRSYLQTLVKAIMGADTFTVRTNVAVGSVLLASPNGSVYTVTVSDTGTLTTTLVHDA